MSYKLKPELEQLVAIIQSYPDGVAISDLLQHMAMPIPRRTMQYRLSRLVKAGILQTKGLGKSLKYYSVAPVKEPLLSECAFQLALSPAGKALSRQMEAPPHLRKHVSYQRDFLDGYEPNKTRYLPESTISKLSQLSCGTAHSHPAGTYARKIYNRLLIDLAWNSSRLEGNTYSLLETERLLATGEETAGKNRLDAQMILNHKAAIEFIIDMAPEIGINRYTILNIHGLLSRDLLADARACGSLRTRPVNIGLSVYHPTEVPQILEECFQSIIDKAAAIINPFEQSFFLMVHLPYLQPFIDVNKRVSRLVGNIPLICANLSPISFVDVPEKDYIQGLLAIYELNRIELFRDIFVWAYERSANLYLATQEALCPPDPFRVRYRDYIQQAVFTVVHSGMDRLQGAKFIAEFAKEHLPSADRRQFIEIAEVEVSSLHEGNFARFKIRPSEFFAWQRTWR